MMNSTIQKWGNSAAVRLPKTVMETVSLKVNDGIEITVEQGNIIIRKSIGRHKTLNERLKGFSGEYTGAEWDTGASVGREVL